MSLFRLAVGLNLFLFMITVRPTSCLVKPNRSNELVMVERAYVKWVRQMASFKHSLFQKGKNKFEPCLTVEVSKKNKRVGGFVTVQEAINSLPTGNLCRVVITVGAGTYRYWLFATGNYWVVVSYGKI